MTSFPLIIILSSTVTDIKRRKKEEEIKFIELKLIEVLKCWKSEQKPKAKTKNAHENDVTVQKRHLPLPHCPQKTITVHKRQLLSTKDNYCPRKTLTLR